MACKTAHELVAGLVTHQLLDSSQYEELGQLQKGYEDPVKLGRELVRRDWITSYQFRLLLKGRGNELVLGQYVLLDKAGQGGMGQVFKARQRSLNRVVAVKLLRRDCLGNPRMLQRFQREMQATARLCHPNLIHAFDADRIGSTQFIVMEFIAGVDLNQLVRELGPLPVDQACDYIRQAAMGLAHAHQHGLIHRDIKPGNMLVSQPTPANDPGATLGSGQFVRPVEGLYPWGLIKLLDLGLVRSEQKENSLVTQLGAVMGTPDFIAPEQARDAHSSDTRADLYSLGCSFYYLLTAQVPFPRGSLTDKLLQHQFDDPQPLENVRREQLQKPLPLGQTWPGLSSFDVPAEVGALVRRLMAKRPEDRLQSAGELVEQLDGIQKRLASASDSVACTQRPLVPPTMPASADLGMVPPELNVTTVREASTDPRPLPIWRRFAVGFLALPLCLGMLVAQLGSRPRASDIPVAKVEKAEEIVWREIEPRVVTKDKKKLDELRQDLIQYRAQFWQSPHARKVANLLTELPSPLDQLERKKFEERAPWLPTEVVTVLGFPKPLLPKGSMPRAMSAAAFSPDGQWLAAAGEDPTIKLWDTAAFGMPVVLKGHRGQVRRLGFAPDGRTLASTSDDGTFKVWDTHTRNLIYEGDHKKPVTAVVFAPDGTTLYTAGHDGVIHLHDLTTRTEKSTIAGQIGKIHCLALSPDGQTLFWGGDYHELHWTHLAQPTSSFLSDLPAPAWALSVHPDGKLVVAGLGNGRLNLHTWDGKILKNGASRQEHNGAIHDVAFGPAGAKIFTGSEDASLRIWDDDVRLVRTVSLRWPVFALALAPDGRHLATANANGTVFLVRP